ncbi:MAG: hypothetical protein ABIF01_03975 [Candidatus Micrarchaeota archaeon]
MAQNENGSILELRAAVLETSLFGESLSSERLLALKGGLEKVSSSNPEEASGLAGYFFTRISAELQKLGAEQESYRLDWNKVNALKALDVLLNSKEIGAIAKLSAEPEANAKRLESFRTKGYELAMQFANSSQDRFSGWAVSEFLSLAEKLSTDQAKFQQDKAGVEEKLPERFYMFVQERANSLVNHPINHIERRHEEVRGEIVSAIARFPALESRARSAVADYVAKTDIGELKLMPLENLLGLCIDKGSAEEEGKYVLGELVPPKRIQDMRERVSYLKQVEPIQEGIDYVKKQLDEPREGKVDFAHALKHLRKTEELVEKLPENLAQDKREFGAQLRLLKEKIGTMMAELIKKPAVKAIRGSEIRGGGTIAGANPAKAMLR